MSKSKAQAQAEQVAYGGQLVAVRLASAALVAIGHRMERAQFVELAAHAFDTQTESFKAATESVLKSLEAHAPQPPRETDR